MSKYNRYAQAIREQFAECGKAYIAAAELGKRAKQAQSAAEAVHTESYYGEFAEKTAAAAELKARHAAAKAKAIQGWKEFDSFAAEQRRLLVGELSIDFSMNPDHLDTGAVNLMNAGVLNPDQMAELLVKYNGNYTMEQTVKVYAQKAAEAAKDNETAARFSAVALKAGDPKVAILAEFDTLISMCNTCSGNARGRRDAEAEDYVCEMISALEENCQNSFESF